MGSLDIMKTREDSSRFESVVEVSDGASVGLVQGSNEREPFLPRIEFSLLVELGRAVS